MSEPIAELPTRVDLHTHTTASDGDLTPSELLARASELGLYAVSITDHDTVSGLREGAVAAAEHGVELVPGIELNCEMVDGHADVLGYFIEPSSPRLVEVLARIRSARFERARGMVRALRRLGASIEYEDVLRLAGDGVVARPHVARALADSGFVPDVAAAFRDLIGRTGPAYVDRYRLSPQDGCRLIRDSGGVPSLAHPVPVGNPRLDPLSLRRFLPELVQSGLGGLECRYPGYSASVTRWLETLAEANGLIPTGGSDFHGDWRPQNPLGGVDVDYQTVKLLVQEARAGPR